MLRSSVSRYSAALASVAVAGVLRVTLDPILGDRIPFITFFVAVFFSAWYGGLGPGITAVLGGFVAAEYLMLSPVYGFSFEDPQHWLPLGLYLLVATAYLVFAELLHRAERTARASEQRALEQRDQLAREIAERQRAEVEKEKLRRDLESRLIEFRTLLDVVPVGIGVCEDAGCDEIWANPALCRMLGVPPSEKVAVSGAASECDVPYRVYQNGRELPAAERPIQLAAARGQTLNDVELEIVGGDGVRHTVLAYAAPLFNPDGMRRGAVAAYLDITDRKEYEERISRDEQRLRVALEAGRMGTWDWELTTNRVNWSPGLEQLHGLSPGTFPGTFEAFQQDIHPDDRQYVLNAIRETVEDGQEYDLEYRLIWPDGSLHWVESRGKLFTDSQGRPIRMLGVCSDATERKRLEEELRNRFQETLDAEERIQSVLDNVVDGIVTVDEQGTIHTINRAGERLFGYSAEELVGQNVCTLMPEPFASAHNGYLAHYLETGQARVIGIGREALGLRKDGSTFPLDLGVSEFRLRQRRFFTGIVRDITERKRWADEINRLNQDLQRQVAQHCRSEQIARFLAEASATLAVLIDYESTLRKVANLAVPFFADWCTVYSVNDDGEPQRIALAHADSEKLELARELGRRYPPNRGAPAGVWHVIETGEPEFAATITDAMLEAAAQDAEHLRILREAGLKSYVCVPLKVRGKVFGAMTFVVTESDRQYDLRDLAVATDLSNRVAIAIENSRLYAELREADRRKDEFLAMLAHELRNPLAPISNALILLGSDEVDAETSREAREIMVRQVEHLVRLVDDLLDVSRIMRGKIELRSEPTDLTAVVTRAVETARPLIEAQRHEFTVSMPDEPIPIVGDDIRLAQAISNLLNNAAKYTEPGGRIVLTVTKHDGGAVISVRDNGVGIDTPLLPHVFELFTQSDRSIARSQGGLGIGLTLVQRLIEMHGGSVAVHSAGAGKGSEFVVNLPVSAELPPNRPTEAEAPTPARRVLVVEDNVGAAKILAMMLRKLGNHEVEMAHDGLEALQVASSFRPEIILLDIGLPGLSGYDVAQRLRAQPEFDGTLIVALTGYGQEEDRRRSREAGFDEHLVKPPALATLKQLFVHPKLADRSERPAPA